jgi:hypothetical protein
MGYKPYYLLTEKCYKSNMYHFSLCANAVPDLIILYYVLFEQLMLDPLRIKTTPIREIFPLSTMHYPNRVGIKGRCKIGSA